MNGKIMLSLIAASAVLVGCSSSPSGGPVVMTEAPPTGCNSDAVSHLVGRAASAALLNEAQVKAGASRARVVSPTSMVTMDYDRQRLNLNVDAENAVVSVTCG